MTDKRIEVKTRGDKVIIDVEGQDSMMVLNPALAVQIGKSLIDAAVHLGVDVRLEVQSKPITNTLRLHMISRAANVVRSMKAKQPSAIAAHVVDSVLGLLP